MGQVKQIVQRDKKIIDCLVDIWESAVKETHTFLSIDDINAIKPEARQYFAEIAHLYCFCDDNDNYQGFIGIEEGKIEMLFVNANARGQGIGKQLLNYAINNLNAKYVDVNEQNEQGIGFYSRMGFKVIGRSELDGQGRPFPLLHLEIN